MKTSVVIRNHLLPFFLLSLHSPSQFCVWLYHTLVIIAFSYLNFLYFGANRILKNLENSCHVLEWVQFISPHMEMQHIREITSVLIKELAISYMVLQLVSICYGVLLADTLERIFKLGALGVQYQTLIFLHNNFLI